MEFPIHASCQCGQVSYALKAEPKMVVACHCKECQKLATAPFSITAMVDAKDIEFHGEMKVWSRIAESGNNNEAYFCTDCGNRIYHFNPAEPDKIKLKLKPTTLDDYSMFAPKAHVWVSEKQNWVEIPEGMKQFTHQP